MLGSDLGSQYKKKKKSKSSEGIGASVIRREGELRRFILIKRRLKGNLSMCMSTWSGGVNVLKPDFSLEFSDRSRGKLKYGKLLLKKQTNKTKQIKHIFTVRIV